MNIKKLSSLNNEKLQEIKISLFADEEYHQLNKALAAVQKEDPAIRKIVRDTQKINDNKNKHKMNPNH